MRRHQRPSGPMLGLIPPATPGTVLFWRADAAGNWIWSGPEWAVFTGLSDAESLGRGWLAAVHPDDRATALMAWTDSGTISVSRAPLRVRWAMGDGYARLVPIASPVRDVGGVLCGWIGILMAAPDGHAEALRGVGEIQHHVRNVLAVIRSVARRTAQTSGTVEHYASHFEGRLDALARIQDAVIRSSDGGVDLEGLLGEELLASRVVDASVRIEGPSLRLRARAAEALGLTLHELVLNAVKFGAFAAATGAVTVCWTIDADLVPPRLRFTWRETGVVVAGPAPRRQGFGTELIERSLPYELNAVTRLDFTPGEVRCTIDMPLTDEVVLPDVPSPSRAARPDHALTPSH